MSRILCNIFFLGLMLALLSCTKDAPFPCSHKLVCMRIKNASNYHFTALNISGIEFGDLKIKKGRISDYAGYSEMHDYPHVELKIDGDAFHTFWICGTGLQYYHKGAFTCEVNVLDYKKRILDVQLIKH